MNFIGNNCKIDPTAIIGDNCCIGDNTIIRKNVIIGDNVIVGENCVIGETPSVWDASPDDERFDKRLFIGDGCCFKPFVVIERGFLHDAKIGKNCFFSCLSGVGHDVIMGDNCLLFPQACLHSNVTVGDNVRFYTSSMVMDNITVGSNSIIYFRAFVKKSCKDDSFIMGEDSDTLKEYCKKRNFLKRASKTLQRIKDLEDTINGKDRREHKEEIQQG